MVIGRSSSERFGQSALGGPAITNNRISMPNSQCPALLQAVENLRCTRCPTRPHPSRVVA